MHSTLFFSLKSFQGQNNAANVKIVRWLHFKILLAKTFCTSRSAEPKRLRGVGPVSLLYFLFYEEYDTQTWGPFFHWITHCRVTIIPQDGFCSQGHSGKQHRQHDKLLGSVVLNLKHQFQLSVQRSLLYC